MATNATDQRETSSLIASDKVEGTNVYRSDGESIGEIERVMIDKRSGNVAYAVMSFGGILGIGEDYYPLPWSQLKYNEQLGGYQVDLSETQLTDAPKFGKQQDWDWNEQRMSEVNTYYGVRAA
jgi:sporulation protein YlmC with PRC-barrel domain